MSIPIKCSRWAGLTEGFGIGLMLLHSTWISQVGRSPVLLFLASRLTATHRYVGKRGLVISINTYHVTTKLYRNVHIFPSAHPIFPSP